MTPYYDDGTVTLYVGDCREILPALGVTADLVVADPPYEETSHKWDRWPDGWLDTAANASRSLWCFGSMRTFGERWREFETAGWRYSQDIIARKALATSFTRDRFRRRHETATHWYRGKWGQIYHDTPSIPHDGPSQSRAAKGGKQQGVHGSAGNRAYRDTGMRLATSVLEARSTRTAPGAGGRSLHPTQKCTDVLKLLISYGCPPAGLALDPFAGSGSTLDAARQCGRRAIGIEAHEPYAEKAARRLEQLTLIGGGS